MTLQKSTRRAVVLMGCSLAIGAGAAEDKPLKVIVPAPAGGSMDVAARIVGQQMSADTGRTVIVENRVGASGSMGLNAMLQAPADGNTIVMGAINLVVESPLVMKVPYDPLKDMLTLARLAQTSRVLVTSANYPAKDFAGLMTELKARKGKTSFASFGTGTSSHYAGLILSHQAELDMQHVGYNGSPPALQDVIGRQVDIMFDSLLTSLPLIKAGKLRAYAVAGQTRTRNLPDVPTMAELGFRDIQFPGQIIVLGSSKLPADVVAKLQAAIKKAADAPAVQKKLIDAGLEPDVSIDTQALLNESRSQYQRNAALVKKFNVQAN